MNLDLPELAEMKMMLERALAMMPVPEWYNLEQAYEAKFGSPEYGPSLMTIRRHRALQPRGGTPDGWQNSKKAWRRESVIEWARVDDTTLGSYLGRVAPGCRVPAFILASLRKNGMYAGEIEERNDQAG